MGPSIDAADLYFQHSRSESWVLEEGIVKDGSHSIEQGVGVRAISGEKTGFSYSDEIVLPQLLEASRAARAIAQGGAGAGKPLAIATGRGLYPAIDPVESLPNEDKIAAAARNRRVCALARSARQAGRGQPQRRRWIPSWSPARMARWRLTCVRWFASISR
jgi:TldD protein